RLKRRIATEEEMGGRILPGDHEGRPFVPAPGVPIAALTSPKVRGLICFVGEPDSARGSVVSEPLETRLSVTEWLASPYLGRAVRRIAVQYGLPSQDTPDLLQEVRLALLKTGPEARLNATWIFHTIMHK